MKRLDFERHDGEGSVRNLTAKNLETLKIEARKFVWAKCRVVHYVKGFSLSISRELLPSQYAEKGSCSDRPIW